MKIQLVSDLHMEFAPIEIVNTEGADVLVLSGDIVVADRFTRGEASPYFAQAELWKIWFEMVCAQYERVYYVLGNHEHYHGRFYETYMVLQNALGHIRKLVILDNSFDAHGGFFIVGTTLWTDFNRDNFKAMQVKDGLNDYKLIEGHGYRKLNPLTDVLTYHIKARQLIDHVTTLSDKVIVVGHHAPSYRSVIDEYLYGKWSHLNPGYASHMDAFIEDHPQIKLWTHGHVHSSHDYEIGSTRVVANPRGYALQATGQENQNFNPTLTLEV